MRHTLRRHRVTPDAFTLAIPHDEHWECGHVLGVSVAQRTRNPQRTVGICSALLRFSCQLCDGQVKGLGHGHTHSTRFGMANVKRCVIPLQLWRAKLEQEHADKPAGRSGTTCPGAPTVSVNSV